MLRSYRGIVCALGGLVLAGAAPPPKETKGEQASRTPHPTVTVTPDYTPYPRIEADECYKAKDHDTADLCAQWRAASAAEKAADLAWWNNLLGGIGGVLSLASLMLVILALRQTERSLVEARHANTIARDSYQRQLRAYIGLKKFRVAGLYANQVPEFSIEIQNFGQTPAYSAKIYSCVGWAPFAGGKARIKFDKIKPIGTIECGGLRGVESGNELPGWNLSLYNSVMSKETRLFHAGFIVYRDAFEKRRITTFFGFVEPVTVENGQASARLADRGNRAS